MSDPMREVTPEGGADKRVDYWLKEIDLAKKRERKWRKDAERVTKIYEAGDPTENSYNILFSNTDTLLPSCYNQLPRPFVDRRFKDADPLGKAAATTLERALSFLQDTGDAQYMPFNSLIQEAVLSALVPGRGMTWFKYEAKFEDTPPPLADGADEKGPTGGAVEEGEAVGQPAEHVTYESICGQDLGYEDLLMGYAKTWDEMPWLAKRHEMTKSDAEKNFGKEIAEDLKYNKPSARDADGQKKSDDEQEDNHGTVPVVEVYEIWVKSKRQVIFLDPQYNKKLLKELEDPYGLSGFFPCPQPLQFLFKKSSLTPTPIYKTYEQQAKELNRVTQRINKIIEALKVRGFYDGTVGGLKDLLNKPDNTLIEAKNTAAMKDNQTMDRSIWLMPLDKLITVLQQLYIQREQVKGVIYEITGISDIIRGDTKASETFGAQQLKSQWGSLRLKKMQGMVQEYVRGCLRVMGELAGKHFSIETFASMTGLDFATPEQLQQAQQMQQAIQQAQMQQAQQAQMMAAQQPQMPQQPGAAQAGPMGGPPQAGPPQGQPPQGDPAAAQAGPPQDPAMQQAMQEVQAILAKTKWADVVGLLKDDLLRDYRIDIETNSTISPNTQEDKELINDAMTAISTMYQSLLPAVQAGALTMPALKAMLLVVARRMQFGREVEDAINLMPEELPPPPPDPGAPTPGEIQAKEAKAQLDAQAAQLKMASDQKQAAADDQKRQLDMAAMQRDEELAQRKHQLTMQEMASKERIITVKEEGAIREARLKVELAQIAVDKARLDQSVNSANAETAKFRAATDRDAAIEQKAKIKRDGEVHSAESRRKIRDANAPAPRAST